MTVLQQAPTDADPIPTPPPAAAGRQREDEAAPGLRSRGSVFSPLRSRQSSDRQGAGVARRPPRVRVAVQPSGDAGARWQVSAGDVPLRGSWGSRLRAHAADAGLLLLTVVVGLLCWLCVAA